MAAPLSLLLQLLLLLLKAVLVLSLRLVYDPLWSGGHGVVGCLRRGGAGHLGTARANAAAAAQRARRKSPQD